MATFQSTFVYINYLSSNLRILYINQLFLVVNNLKKRLYDIRPVKN